MNYIFGYKSQQLNYTVQCTLSVCTVRIVHIEEEEDRRESKGRRCCLKDGQNAALST